MPRSAASGFVCGPAGRDLQIIIPRIISLFHDFFVRGIECLPRPEFSFFPCEHFIVSYISTLLAETMESEFLTVDPMPRRSPAR